MLSMMKPMNRNQLILILSCLTGIFVAVLHWMGRIPYCECGLKLLTTSAASSETSQHFLDPYSFSHVLHGILFFGLLWFFRKWFSMEYRLLIAAALEIGWEVLENTPLIINRYRDATAALGYTGDSILNSIGDLLCALLGFWIAWKLSLRWTVAAVIAIELLMLWTIRDNLTLNIIMLLYPIEAIKDWQLQ